MTQPTGLLLVIPAPFRLQGTELMFEAQACNGLERWAENFETVTIAAPVMPEEIVAVNPGFAWRSTQTLSRRIKVVPLPWGYSSRQFGRYYYPTRRKLRQLITEHAYLQFGIGGLIGDWAAIAALEAKRQQRPYAIHTDLVEHEAVLRIAENVKNASWYLKTKAKVFSAMMLHYYHYIIRHASLGLWHGADCYSVYGPWCDNSYLIHNIHTKPNDQIDDVSVAAKVCQVKTDEPLHLCYVGRMEAMKAPLDWVRAIYHATLLGANIKATWIGDGRMRPLMEAMITARGLGNTITLLEFEADRARLLQQIRNAHLMPFTHITPESPRCLIESLISATPIVGYGSHYTDNLVELHGGGEFVDVGNWQALGELIVALDRDRPHCAQLIQQAIASGRRFSDEAVFRERSDLIKKHLTPPTQPDSQLAQPLASQLLG